ncbi:g10293 [Coccomyxa elongata]
MILPTAWQSNDAIFQQAKAGRITCKVDSVAAVEAEHIVLGSGERIRADVIVAAYGLKYQAEPEFLKELGIGFKDLHNFAFLGPSGRIGTAQDGIYAYVPAGPHKQFDMLLHSYACYKKGMLQAFQEQAMEHTPIPQTSYESLGAGNHRSAWGTWFEVAKPWSVMNSTFEWRARVYYSALSFGRSPLGKLQLRLQIAMADLFQFICLIFLGMLEYFHDPSPLEIKKNAKKSDVMKKAA